MDETVDNFINIPFSSSNLDRYVVRMLLKRSLLEVFPVMAGQLLDAGCGKMPYRTFVLNNSAVTSYVGLDIESALVYDRDVKPDFTWDGSVMPFEQPLFECALATEVLEHCPEPEVFLKEVNRVLKPEGIFIFTVPFLWNLHEVPHDEYRYTPFSLKRHLENSGFRDIKISATGGWHAAMAQMIGLWVRRSGLRRWIRTPLSILCMPLIKLLLKMDKPPVVFSEGVMITGLYGTARKG